MRHPYFARPLPIVFGHRGASGERPENTLPAFALAIAQGAAALETDVHLTRDGHVVVFHDDRLERTTDGEGPIAARSLAELRQLDAGHRFSPDGGATHPWRGAGIRIPTLDELFEAHPRVPINVEVKAESPALIEGTLRCIGEHDRSDRTLLAAAEDGTMAALRAAVARHGMKVAMGASLGDVLGFVRAAVAGEPPPPEPMALQIPAEFGGRPLVTPELIAFAHAHDVQVHVWTVNEERQMDALLDLGVDGLMSDFPALLCERVAARGGAR